MLYLATKTTPPYRERKWEEQGREERTRKGKGYNGKRNGSMLPIDCQLLSPHSIIVFFAIQANQLPDIIYLADGIIISHCIIAVE